MRDDYVIWLQAQGYEKGTQSAQLNRVRRVENAYGSLDEHDRNGSLETVLSTLQYSKEDERNAKPNPASFPIDGNLRNNLASYKDAVNRYVRFLRESETPSRELASTEALDELNDAVAQKFSMERDMQIALRQRISALDPTLHIIDGGAERYVESGRIDITCKDGQGLVVVELKAGVADGKAIGQILGYMGDLQEEEESSVRGILVAHDFDKRARSAAKAVPHLTLVKYSIEFKFTAVG